MSVIVFEQKIASFYKKKIQNKVNFERIRMDMCGFKSNLKFDFFD